MDSFLEQPRIYYRKKIIPGRSCLLFFHGIFGTSSAWVKYEEGLKNFSFISPDLRGHGKSFRPGNMTDYDFSVIADDFYKIIKKEKIKKIILVGNSYGNFIAFEFLKKYPELIEKAIFISPYDKPDRIPMTKFSKPFVKLFCKINVCFKTNIVGKHFDYYSKYKGKHTGDWDFKRLYPDIKNTGLRSGLCCFSQLYDYSAGDFLYNLDIPTLVIHGKLDSIFPLKYIVKMVDKMKNTKLVVIPDGDHILVVNNYKKLIKVMRDFLNS
jgi:pimeloyl-ACP methyl ester carboxylesterase